MRARPWWKALDLFLLVAFLLAAGGEVLPGHGCAHHGGLSASASGGHDHRAPTPAGEDRGHVPSPGHQDTGAPEPGHGDGPCTCVGACHAGAATPVASDARLDRLALPTAPDGTAVFAPSDGPARRPLPYRLHQPNAPPVRA